MDNCKDSRPLSQRLSEMLLGFALDETPRSEQVERITALFAADKETVPVTLAAPLPEWVKHIRSATGGAWCTVAVHAFDWLFLDLAHAEATIANEEYLVPCDRCLLVARVVDANIRAGEGKAAFMQAAATGAVVLQSLIQELEGAESASDWTQHCIERLAELRAGRRPCTVGPDAPLPGFAVESVFVCNERLDEAECDNIRTFMLQRGGPHQDESSDDFRARVREWAEAR